MCANVGRWSILAEQVLMPACVNSAGGTHMSVDSALKFYPRMSVQILFMLRARLGNLTPHALITSDFFFLIVNAFQIHMILKC